MIKLESKPYNLFLDSKEVEKHLEELLEAYDNAPSAEEALRAAWRYDAAKDLIEALRKAEEAFNYLAQEGIVEG